MKISLITVVYNGEDHLRDCIESVLNQSYENLEYIIIDGGSVDGTLNIIKDYRTQINIFVSEMDKGLYDAINKGIHLATGEVIGILNSDDMLASEHVLATVAIEFMKNKQLDGLYGNLNYIHPDTQKIIRRWVSRTADWKDLKKGWMPAHPTLYLKRELFNDLGVYALDMGTVADYDLILRYFYQNKINATYLPMLMVNMRMGGISNGSLSARFNALINDHKALKRNKIPNALWVLFRKKFAKLNQF